MKGHSLPYTVLIEGVRLGNAKNRFVVILSGEEMTRVVVGSLLEMGFVEAKKGVYVHSRDSGLYVELYEQSWYVSYRGVKKELGLIFYESCYDLVSGLIKGIREHYREACGL